MFDCEFFFVNNKSYGIKVQEFPHQGHSGAWNKYAKTYIESTTADLHLTWDVAYEPGIIKAVGRKNGQQVIIDEIHTAGEPAALRFTTDTTQISTGDVALIHVDVVDKAGVIVPNADNLVNFTVTGNGRLMGVDNGNPRDDTSFKLNTRKVFNGHAYAILQAGRTGGDITLTAKADGLKPVSITIKTAKASNSVIDFEDFR